MLAIAEIAAENPCAPFPQWAWKLARAALAEKLRACWTTVIEAELREVN
jgi:hypothetical protein